jgi:uncharacterized protein (DUF433 family)
MQLEDYFNFLAPNDIRLKGHRIGIETILYEYIHNQYTAEEIADIYTTLTLEQVYATILYYLHNKEDIHNYMTEWLEHGRRMREEQERNPTPLMLKLRRLKAKQNDEKREVAEHSVL